MGNSNPHQLKSDSEPLMIMVSGFDFFPDSLRYESPIEYSEIKTYGKHKTSTHPTTNHQPRKIIAPGV